MSKTTRQRKARPKYRVQLVKSAYIGLWFHRIKGANGETIASSEIYDAKVGATSRSNARRTAKPLAEALGTELEVVEENDL